MGKGEELSFCFRFLNCQLLSLFFLAHIDIKSDMLLSWDIGLMENVLELSIAILSNVNKFISKRIMITGF